MISVIIPVLNEANTIAQVVDFVLKSDNVDEVVVVDDKSIDKTVLLAEKAGAKVITSTKLGKGASMKEGILYCKNDFVVFLDGDIHPYPNKTIEKLTKPLFDDSADFVKATFARQAGRVTELVAKPLLSLLFPDISKFSQPLSGMIAGRKSFFEKVDFAEDYGVDIGLLIDMHMLSARIEEVNIGSIENKMKPWQELSKMSKEVSASIIRKAFQYPNSLFSLSDMKSIEIIRDQMEYSIKEGLKSLKKMVIFDMDNTLLNGRFIDTCADKFNFKKELYVLRNTITDSVMLTKRIATLLKGLNTKDLLDVVEEIPLVDDAKLTIAELKNRGYIIGIISDSFTFITEYIKNKVGADFSLANELEFSKSISTGEVKVPSYFFHHQSSLTKEPVCKSNALLHILKEYKISLSNVIAVGDGRNDIGMIAHAGMGVAFCPTDDYLSYVADYVIKERSFKPLLTFAE